MQGTIQNYALDMADGKKNVPLRVKQYDTNSRWASISLTAFGEPWPVPAGCRACIAVKKTDGTSVLNDCTVEGSNTVLAPITDQTTAVQGIQQAELYFLAVDGDIKSQTFPINVYPAIMDQRVIESSNEFGTLQTAIIGAQEATRTAQDAASEAMVQAGEARDAAEIAIDAAASLDVAVQAAAAAKTSETNAKASETAAAQSKADVEAMKAAFAGYDKVESGRKYANALTTTAEGDGQVTVTDAWEAPVVNLEVDGASEQVVTTGAQLFDFDAWRQMTRVINGTGVLGNGRVTLTAGSNGDAYTNYSKDTLKIPVKKNTTYTLSWEYSGAEGRVYVFQNGKDGGGKMALNSAKKLEIDTVDEDFLTFRVGVQAPNATASYWNIMLNEGDTALPWEPYTGGKPSPSPDYPQEIVSVAHVANSGAQLFDASRIPTKTASGVTVTNNGDGSFTISGTGTTTKAFYSGYTLTHEESVQIFPIGDYTVATSPVYPLLLFRKKIDGTFTDIDSITGRTLVITEEDILNDTYQIAIGFSAGISTTIIPGVIWPMIYKKGNTAQPWEPYNGQQREIDFKVESSGAQLLDYLSLPSTTMNGVTFTPQADGTVSATGLATDVSAFDLLESELPPGTYHISGCPKGATMETYQIIAYRKTGGNFTILGVDTGSGAVFNVVQGDLIVIRTVLRKGTSGTIAFKPMLNAGSMPMPWEPYTGYQSVTIPLTEPLHGIGDVKDRFGMRDGVWGIERQFVKIVLNGTESWASYASVGSKSFGVSTYDNIIKKSKNLLCDNLSKDDEVNVWKGKKSNTISVDTTNTDYRLRIYLDETTTLQSLKDKFAANPVEVIVERNIPTWEPFPESTQAALNALTTHPGTTYLTVTSTDVAAPVRLTYVQDTRKVIDALQLDVAEQMIELQAQIDQLKVTNNLS